MKRLMFIPCKRNGGRAAPALRGFDKTARFHKTKVYRGQSAVILSLLFRDRKREILTGSRARRGTKEPLAAAAPAPLMHSRCCARRGYCTI
ncbi:hypothetical protein EVAR_86537_1 [Eumeta japonica]|uniref:Uncharacterized protein n=1 Tax=Eumeta variegata TaxID=151549 RepID=A0A4C1VPC1_EUMVA|nr:hypothetical protein EVAR_86537_1 [Eumeta japonica]